MPRRTEMDHWSHDDVLRFKERGRLREAEQLEHALPALQTRFQLVAEGDSWFDYLPGTDLIDYLRVYHGYRIDNFAKAGDTLENMIYGNGTTRTFERVTPTITRVLGRLEAIRPKALLFSGGGNDVEGDEIESYLNHANSRLPAQREDFADYLMDVVFRKYFEDLIAKVKTASPRTLILTHGYGLTRTTGKGVEFLFFQFAGPWLLPALARKGIPQADHRTSVVQMINRFNELLASLAADYAPRFQYVNLRDFIDPMRDWANELHLVNSAFAAAAEAIHQRIAMLPDSAAEA